VFPGPAGAGGLILPAAIIIFPISYTFGDVLTEVYGYARARRQPEMVLERVSVV
jgi:uncharacterized PurR-regulated membrane protein YhhQ (DUF165 family)